MSEPTWDDGPWIVTHKIVYLVQGCGAHTAARAALRHIKGLDDMEHGESWPAIIEHMSTHSIVSPGGDGPFDLDHEIKQMRGE